MTGTADSLVLRCTGMDIKMLEMNIPAADQWLDIIVTTSPLVIREAKVKADPMSAKGDTVVYFVGVENLDSELSVGDAGGQQRTDFVENTLHNNPPDSLKNGLTLKRIDFILSPSVEYSLGGPMKVTLSFPVDYRISKVTGLHNNRFLLPPRLTVSGDATNNLRYNISASYNDIEGEINDL